MTPVTLDWDAAAIERGETRLAVLDDDLDVVFQRKDPPVDNEYVVTTQILGSCSRALPIWLRGRRGTASTACPWTATTCSRCTR